jgi:hypothetical protein
VHEKWTLRASFLIEFYPNLPPDITSSGESLQIPEKTMRRLNATAAVCPMAGSSAL